MQLTPETLTDHKFELDEVVIHSQFNAFLYKHAWKFSRLYFIYMLVVFVLLLMTITFFLISPESVLDRLLYMALGIVLSLLLIPLHECIHLITYKILGAKKVTLSSYIKRWYILTQADQFVVGRSEMQWLATTPFIIISLLGFLLLGFVNDLWQISISSMILFHATLCMADFRILDYFVSSTPEKVMYSDIKKDESYIYKRTHE